MACDNSTEGASILINGLRFGLDFDDNVGHNIIPFCAEVAEWQTQRIQNPPGATSCGFDSHLRHHFFFLQLLCLYGHLFFSRDVFAC